MRPCLTLQSRRVWIILTALSVLLEAEDVLMVLAILRLQDLQHEIQRIRITRSILLSLIDLTDLLQQNGALDVVDIPKILLIVFHSLRVVLEAFSHFLQVVPDVP